MAEDNEALGPVDVFMISLAFCDLLLADSVVQWCIMVFDYWVFNYCRLAQIIYFHCECITSHPRFFLKNIAYIIYTNSCNWNYSTALQIRFIDLHFQLFAMYKLNTRNWNSSTQQMFQLVSPNCSLKIIQPPEKNPSQQHKFAKQGHFANKPDLQYINYSLNLYWTQNIPLSMSISIFVACGQRASYGAYTHP